MAESVLVSARVPQAKKDASKGVLASLGVNTSDLIKSVSTIFLRETGAADDCSFFSPSREELDAFSGRFDTRCRLEGERRPMAIIALLVREWKARRYESLA